jgi:phage terminase small subunit
MNYNKSNKINKLLEVRYMKDLNLRQQKFIEYYIQSGNGKQSYIKAGYSARGNAAEVNAARLLRNARIS